MLHQLYSYLQVHPLVRIGDLAELFGVHRSTIWRNMRKLEQAGLVRSVRTEDGVKVEVCGSWVESAHEQRVTARRMQRRVGRGGSVSCKKVRGQKLRGVADGEEVREAVRGHVASRKQAKVSRKGHVAACAQIAESEIGDVACCKRTGRKGCSRVGSSHVASPSTRARIKSFYKYSIPQLVARTRDSGAVFELPRKVSTAQVRQIAAWIRSSVDLIAFLASLGVRVYRRNRAGENPCCCPLHDDRHPSFYANREKGIWYCHACQISGDAVELVRRLKVVRFGEAVRWVLDAVRKSIRGEGGGLLREPLELVTQTWPLGKSEARSVHQAVQRVVHNSKKPISSASEQREEQWSEYARGFSNSERAKDYLERRGIALESVTSFGIGYDEQRDAIVFPIRSTANGAVLGFTYRSVDPQSDWRYHNTPNDAIYTKGAHLFGFYEIKQRAATLGQLFVTEGIFDALHLIQSGQAAVAMQGVHLTDEQVELICSLGGDIGVILALDNDRAGEKGTEHNKRLLREKGIRYHVWRLPKGYKDVAEFLVDHNTSNLEVVING